MSESINDPEMTALERALRQMQPSASQVDRDDVMFRAGKASASRTTWRWPAATAAMALIAAGLGTALVVREPPTPVERIVYVHQAMPDSVPSDQAQPLNVGKDRGAEVALTTAPGEPTPLPISYAQLSSQAFRHGVEALPEAPAVTASHVSPMRLGRSEDAPVELPDY